MKGKLLSGAGESAQQEPFGFGAPTKGSLSHTRLGTLCGSEAPSSCFQATPADDSGPTPSDDSVLAERKATIGNYLGDKDRDIHHHTIYARSLAIAGVTEYCSSENCSEMYEPSRDSLPPNLFIKGDFTLRGSLRTPHPVALFSSTRKGDFSKIS